MRTREEFLTEYAKSHRNLSNQIIHLLCVPLIYFASVGLLWAIKISPSWLGLPESSAPYLNVATLLFVPILAFYARLGLQSLATGVTWSVLSAFAVVAIESSGMSVVAVCGAIWLAAWVFQFVGHHIEKAKPSFGDDLVFLLIGPLFVQYKLQRMISDRSLSVLRA